MHNLSLITFHKSTKVSLQSMNYIYIIAYISLIIRTLLVLLDIQVPPSIRGIRLYQIASESVDKSKVLSVDLGKNLHSVAMLSLCSWRSHMIFGCCMLMIATIFLRLVSGSGHETKKLTRCYSAGTSSHIQLHIVLSKYSKCFLKVGNVVF